jgi:hypothetical protein
MSPENTRWLRSQFPALYPQTRLDRSLSDDPHLSQDDRFECGDGWEALVYRLSRAIAIYAFAVGLNVSVTQVKEKFGMLLSTPH